VLSEKNETEIHSSKCCIYHQKSTITVAGISAHSLQAKPRIQIFHNPVRQRSTELTPKSGGLGF